MYELGGCAKCQGDLFLRNDLYGWYWDCLQCGHTIELAIKAPISHPVIKPAARIPRRRPAKSQTGLRSGTLVSMRKKSRS